ncbi:transposase [Streptomyces sp. AC555_RSS877]|uniref:transposase n=1 Tax=Streptomyces sp. AC555_RSS877 TaxID=2823688 RepID=UPI0027E4AA3F|nr:transposase [Streptomyces sp. AC555_RSS877]
MESNGPSPAYDCLAHRFGNAADGPVRVRCYGSDLTEAEWPVLRPLLPVPAWLQGRGGRPEGNCHRVMLDAVRYVVDNGVKWKSTCPVTSRRTSGARVRPPLAGHGSAR